MILARSLVLLLLAAPWLHSLVVADDSAGLPAPPVYIARLPAVTDEPPIPPPPTPNVPPEAPPEVPPEAPPPATIFPAPGQVLEEGCYDELSCDVAPPGWRMIAGAEVTLLKPNVDDAPFFFSNGAGYETASDEAHLEQWTVAPRIWAGMEHCSGLGVRARYWQFTAQDSATDVELGGPFGIEPALSRATRDLTAWTADLEATYRCLWSGVLMLGSIGARHARLSRDESLTGIVSFDRVTSTITSESSFEGTGILVGVEGWFPLDTCGQFQFLARVGNSLLWGKNCESANSLLVTPNANLYQAVIGDEFSHLFIFECQAGIQWNGVIDCLDSYAFARLMAECQMWNGSATSFSFDQTVNAITQSGSSRDLDVRFFGITAAVGVMW